MKIEFNEDELANELNKILIEADDLTFICRLIEGEGKSYVLTGSAIIEDEKYNDFQMEIELTEELSKPNASDIMNTEWEWYDYLC